MVPTQILMLSVFAQVTLTFFMFARTAMIRANDMKTDPALLKTAAVDSTKYSEKAQQVANSYNSQFQLPVLFYAVVIFAMLTASESWLFAGLAGLFVFTRIVHMIIHTTSNVIMNRFVAFLAGYIILVAMWITLAVNFFV